MLPSASFFLAAIACLLQPEVHWRVEIDSPEVSPFFHGCIAVVLINNKYNWVELLNNRSQLQLTNVLLSYRNHGRAMFIYMSKWECKVIFICCILRLVRSGYWNSGHKSCVSTQERHGLNVPIGQGSNNFWRGSTTWNWKINSMAVTPLTFCSRFGWENIAIMVDGLWSIDGWPKINFYYSYVEYLK